MSKFFFHRILGLAFLGMISRLLPHPPNLMAMNAIALFSLCSLGNLGLSFCTVFVAMFLNDLIFGFYSGMGFVYLSLGLIILMGHGLKSHRSLIRSTLLLTLSSFLFFIITNFGVWLLSGMYSHTAEGLQQSYLAAIPFFINNLIGTLIYGTILFGWLALAKREWMFDKVNKNTEFRKKVRSNS